MARGGELLVILEWLVSEFGQQLDLSRSELASRLGQKLADNTVRAMLAGTGGEPTAPTRRQLTAIFRPAVPHLHEHHFTAETLEQFKGRLHRVAANYSCMLSVNCEARKLREMEEYLVGTHVAYRYAFEAHGEEDRVAREVVRIDKSGSSFSFNMSFWGDRHNDPEQQSMAFSGIVIPVGLSVIMVGLNEGQARLDRGRCLVIHEDGPAPRARQCRLGMLSSTRLYENWAPCAASTILVRLQWKPKDLDGFVDDATTMGSFSDIIEKDFGVDEERLLWLRAFLDNRPFGTDVDEDLKRLEGSRQRDWTLRLDPGRFNSQMPSILKAAVDDPDICAPFKSNWPNRSHKSRQ
jgi:hypothetical protein